jgi:phage baseplate assembly protein W
MADIPHLAWPVRLGPGGQLAVVEQDTVDEIVQNVAVITSTTVGARVERPDFGVSDQTFEQQPLDTRVLQQRIDRFEPRASATLDQAWPPTPRES